MNRLRVKVFSARRGARRRACRAAPGRRRKMPGNPNFWFAGTRLIFERAIPLDGDVAVSIRDAGLPRFLAKLGATIAFSRSSATSSITAADHRTITFTIGSAQYSAGGVTARATFAPFVDGSEPIVPLYALAHALYVEPVAGAGETILQPQIGALDIRTRRRVTRRSSSAVRRAGVRQTRRVRRRTSSSRSRGVASTLTGVRRDRRRGRPPRSRPAASPRNPTTIVALRWSARPRRTMLAPPASPFEVALDGGAGRRQCAGRASIRPRRPFRRQRAGGRDAEQRSAPAAAVLGAGGPVAGGAVTRAVAGRRERRAGADRAGGRHRGHAATGRRRVDHSRRRQRRRGRTTGTGLADQRWYRRHPQRDADRCRPRRAPGDCRPSTACASGRSARPISRSCASRSRLRGEKARRRCDRRRRADDRRDQRRRRRRRAHRRRTVGSAAVASVPGPAATMDDGVPRHPMPAPLAGADALEVRPGLAHHRARSGPRRRRLRHRAQRAGRKKHHDRHRAPPAGAAGRSRVGPCA